MTAEFADFYPDLLVHTPGAPDPLLDQALLQAAQEFCKETVVWQEQLDDIGVRANVGVYDLPLPARTRSVLVVSAMFHDYWLIARTTRELNRMIPMWRTQAASGATYFASDVQGQIILTPVPTTRESRAIKNLRVALMPSNEATDLPDILFDDYRQALKYGALRFLHELPKRDQYDWVDPSRVAYFDSMFKTEKGITKIRVAKGFQAGPTYARSGRLAGAP